MKAAVVLERCSYEKQLVSYELHAFRKVRTSLGTCTYMTDIDSHIYK